MITIKCKICGTIFKRNNYQKNTAKYCSKMCKHAGQSKTMSGRIRKPHIKKSCKTCGKIFYVINAFKHTAKYCSRKCKGLEHRKIMKGSNNPAWRGGNIRERNKVECSSKYATWKQNILIRDNFTCRKCGKMDNLEVHHIKSFVKLFNEAKQYLPLLDIYDACMTYTPFWDINNGIVYCNKCHKKIKHHRR